MHVRTTMSEHPDDAQAAGECIGDLLEAYGVSPELCLIAITPDRAHCVDDILSVIKTLLGPVSTMGFVTPFMSTGPITAHHQSGIAVLAAWDSARADAGEISPSMGTLRISPIEAEPMRGSDLIEHLISIGQAEGTPTGPDERLTALIVCATSADASVLWESITKAQLSTDIQVSTGSGQLDGIEVIVGSICRASTDAAPLLIHDDVVHTDGAVALVSRHRAVSLAMAGALGLVNLATTVGGVELRADIDLVSSTQQTLSETMEWIPHLAVGFSDLRIISDQNPESGQVLMAVVPLGLG